MGDLLLCLSQFAMAKLSETREETFPNVSKKKNQNFITVCMARLKFRGKLLGF